MKLFTTILVLLLSICIQGQIPFNVKQKKIDNLLTRLKTVHDTAYVNTLNNLSLNLTDRNFDSAYRYAQQALAWARHYKYKRGEAIAYYNTGNSYFVKMDLKAALEQYFRALRILEPSGPSSDLLFLYFQMGYINSLVPNNDRAVLCFQKALSTSRVIRDPYWGPYVACFEIANYYWQCSWSAEKELSGRYLDSAYSYSLRAFDFVPYDTIRDLDNLIDCLTTKGNILNHMLDSTSYEPLSLALHLAIKLKRTRACSREFLEIDDSTAFDWFIGFAYGNLSQYYMNFPGDLDQAEDYLVQSLAHHRMTPHIESVAATLDGLGWIAKERKQYCKALQCFLESEKLCDTFLTDENRRRHCPAWTRLRFILHTKDRQAGNYEMLSDLFQTTGNLGKALEYQKKKEKLRRSITMTESVYQMNIMQTHFENEQNGFRVAALLRDNELQKMNLVRTRILFGSSGALALAGLFAIIFYLQRNKLQTKQKSLLLEQKLLRSQMNPHFIFNSLTNIQNFILTEKPEKANIYLAKFAVLVRNILDNSVEEYIMLDKEISTIENYLELQKIRYSGKFEYRIHIEDEIDAEAIRIPPMLAQPFIENSIEHGIKHRETPGHIDIRFSLKDHLLVFEVEDDGIGRQKAREIVTQRDPEHKSMATSLTRERLANLNRKLQRKIVLEITDLKNALGEVAGTRVMFGIPVGQ